jgi:hypothetical protein
MRLGRVEEAQASKENLFRDVLSRTLRWQTVCHMDAAMALTAHSGDRDRAGEHRWTSRKAFKPLMSPIQSTHLLGPPVCKRDGVLTLCPAPDSSMRAHSEESRAHSWGT